jgi:hypothetical protein
VSLPTAGGDFTASQQAQEVVAESKTARNEPTLASSTATATATPAPPEAAPVIANVNADDLTAKSPQDAPAIAAPINISAPAAEQITITNTTAMSTQVSTEPAPTSTSISAATAPPAASNKQLELLSQKRNRVVAQIQTLVDNQQDNFDLDSAQEKLIDSLWALLAALDKRIGILQQQASQ